MAHALAKSGMHPIVLDSFATSRRPKNFPFEIHEVDLADLNALSTVWRKLGQVSGVIHFAAYAVVPESCESPDLYFRNNTLATLNTARLCIENDVHALIHSSSCAVYGKPRHIPIAEDAPLDPISPYGEAKRISEQVLNQIAQYKPLKAINLRYFNPAGAFGEGLWGEAHQPETHLIPNIIAAAETKEPISIFGDQYETPDGTCIRDFIHVEDLMDAHLAALQHIEEQNSPMSIPINIGSGTGYSVLQVIAAVEKVMGQPVPKKIMPPRPGDSPRLLADTTRAQALLNWKPIRTIDEMVRSHLNWDRVRTR